MSIYVTNYSEISIMKYAIVSLHYFHVVSLSIAAAFKPVINMEHEAIIGGFKCLYWLLKHITAHQLTLNLLP